MKRKTVDIRLRRTSGGSSHGSCNVQSPLFALAILVVALAGSPAGAQDDTLLGPEAIEAGLVIEKWPRTWHSRWGWSPCRMDRSCCHQPIRIRKFLRQHRRNRATCRLGQRWFAGRTISCGLTGLPGTLVAEVPLARYENIVMVTSAQGGEEGVQFFQAGETWHEPLVELGRLGFGFVGAMHQSYALAVRANADSADRFDLFFNLGAAGNDTDGANVRLSGLLTGVLPPSSVFMTTVSLDGGSIALSEPVQIASGLRNASALVIHPDSGDLWIGENGIDGYDDPIISFSADELNVITADQIGIEVVDFGFPEAYIDYATGENVNDDLVFVDFRPLDGSEAEGIAGMTLAPISFPEPFSGGMIAGFHGQFDLTGVENEENPVRFVNLETGVQTELIVN